MWYGHAYSVADLCHLLLKVFVYICIYLCMTVTWCIWSPIRCQFGVWLHGHRPWGGWSCSVYYRFCENHCMMVAFWATVVQIDSCNVGHQVLRSDSHNVFHKHGLTFNNIINTCAPTLPFGRICFVVLVMRKGGESSCSGPWHLGCTSEVFHVHSYQDQFIQPGWAECVYI